MHYRRVTRESLQDVLDRLDSQPWTRESESMYRTVFETAELQRISAIGMMASGIAHNINSPVMAILGTSQLLMMKSGESEELKSIMDQAKKISDIVKNLTYKGRSEAEKTPVTLDINRLLREELRFLETDLFFKHNVQKDYQFQEPLPTIQAVYSDFSRSLGNIIRNSLDAMYQSPTKKLTVRTYFDDEWILADIEDTGCGIAKENLGKIFEPFYTTKLMRGNGRQGEPTGIGLGLSSTQELLSPYGVEFDVRSEVGQGTRFTVRIPYGQDRKKN